MKRLWMAMLVPLLAVAVTSPAAAQTTGPTPAGLPEDPASLARSWIVFDGSTGAVLAQHNEHERLPPASITKLMTALTVLSIKDPTDTVVATARAENMTPLKVGVKAGETWSVDTLLHGLLMISANDAAVALAEGTSGSLEEFALARQKVATDLGLADDPVFQDPAGMDDTTSFKGGDIVSAHDMALVAGAALQNPTIMAIVKTDRFDFTGADGLPHYFANHNRLLDRYDGAIGMKTGYTAKAKLTYIAAAERNGRTIVTVLFDTKDMYGSAATLLDYGFSASSASGSGETLGLGAVEKVIEEPVVATEPIAAQDAVSETTGPITLLAVGFVLVLSLYGLHHFRQPLARRIVVRYVRVPR